MLAKPLSSSMALACLATLGAGLPTLVACKGCKSDQTITPAGLDDTGDGGGTGPEEYTNDWGQWLTMDVMQDGRPALAYYDKTKGGLGFAIANIDGETVEWEREEADGYTNEDGLDVGDRGKYASMAVASDGTVWVAYQDVALENLRWARRDPTTHEWTNNTADGGSEPNGTAGMFAALDLDSSSNPVIAHYDSVAQDLRVSRYNGTAFTSEVVDEGTDAVAADGSTIPANVGMFADLVIQDGVEYLAYYDAASGDLKLAWGASGSNYTIEVVDSGEAGADVGQWPNIVVQGGQLWISYHDVTNQDLMLATGAPGSWSMERVDQAEFVGADSAIFLNGTQPSIVYFDGRNNDMRLATKLGEDWQSEQLAGDEGALGFHNEVVQAGGAYYGACYDYTAHTVWFQRLD